MTEPAVERLAAALAAHRESQFPSRGPFDAAHEVCACGWSNKGTDKRERWPAHFLTIAADLNDAAQLREHVARLRAALRVEPHRYSPDAIAMGDCRACGHVADSPLHDPSRYDAAQLREENERLRAALKALLEAPVYSTYASERQQDVFDRANAALGTAEGSTEP